MQLVFLAFLYLVIFVAVPDWTFKAVYAFFITVVFWFVVSRKSSEYPPYD